MSSALFSKRAAAFAAALAAGAALSSAAGPAYAADSAHVAHAVTAGTIGDQPGPIFVTPDGTKALIMTDTVGNAVDPAISVVDTATDAVLATVPIKVLTQTLFFSPDGTVAYIVDREGDASALNLSTYALTTIATGELFDAHAALSPNGSELYVTGGISKPADKTVRVYNTATGALAHTYKIAGNPVTITVSADGTRAYVDVFVSKGVSNLVVINTANGETIATIPLTTPGKSKEFQLTFSPDGSKLFASPANFKTDEPQSGTTTVIDTATETVAEAVTLKGPVDLSPTGNVAYELPAGGGSPTAVKITVLNPVTLAETGTVTATVPLSELTFSPNGALAYGYWAGTGNAVAVIDATTGTAVGSIPGNLTSSVAFSPDSTRAYIANYGDNTVQVVDTATDTVIATIDGD